MKKVLIITYYWPPSGGAGVQRWVKLTKYLAKLGVTCHVLTVDEKKASYSQYDQSLINDVSEKIQVYKTDSFEIINWYTKIFGKKNVPNDGFSKVDNTSFKQKIINAIRSNFFIPDPRVGWNKYAIKKAKTIIETEGIRTVITTSPPHSTQLVGLALKNWKNSINWISDLRDPWTDIYYYNLLNHSPISHRINTSYEIKVLKNADEIITVSDGLSQLFQNKVISKDSSKFNVVPNGFDPEDFEGKVKQINNHFKIIYTGSMSDQYNPYPFFEELEIISIEQELEIELILVGSITEDILKYLENSKIHFQYITTLPHSEINQFQLDADLLLLVIPETKHNKVILTGKLFEYLATKNQIINIGPEDGDAAKIITKCGAGESFNRNNRKGITSFLNQLLTSKKNGNKVDSSNNMIYEYSRLDQAKKIKELII